MVNTTVVQTSVVEMASDRKGELANCGVKRCSTLGFFLWLAPWIALLVFGLYCAGLCLVRGLNQTNMDNRFAFGLWIVLDLTVVTGYGAFFTGFLLYILKFKELKAVINSAVVIGLVCYSGAMGALMVDVGQPLRAVVCILDVERALHAHRGHVLHQLLPDRIADRVRADRS